MGEFPSRRSSHYNMQAFVLASMLAAAFAAPSAESKADAYGFYGHHVYHGPPCKHAFVEETKEVCHIEPEKVCETKTRTYKVITGYEDGECKEIEVCKFPGFHHKRSAEPNPHYGHIECKKEPVVEEKSKDFELCHLEPKKVCEEKTFKVPTLDCEEEEKEEEGRDTENVAAERNQSVMCHF